MLKVLKFGGSSLADAQQFAKVKAIVEADASRRVVIKFRMKDADMIDQMSAILEGSAQGD